MAAERWGCFPQDERFITSVKPLNGSTVNERFRWTVASVRPALVGRNAICMNYSGGGSLRYVTWPRNTYVQTRQSHSVIPFVLAQNEIVRISRIVYTTVMADSPRIHYLHSSFLLVERTPPIFFIVSIRRSTYAINRRWAKLSWHAVERLGRKSYWNAFSDGELGMLSAQGFVYFSFTICP